MASRRYFTQKAKYLAKKLKPKTYKPLPAPPFRPITGQRVMEMKWRVKRVKKKKPLRTYRKRSDRTDYILIRVRRFEKMQWFSIADDLDMPLGSLMRMAMRYFLSSSRYVRSLIDGDEEFITVKRVRRSTLEKKLTKSFGADAPDPIAIAIQKEYAKYARMKALKEKQRINADDRKLQKITGPDVGRLSVRVQRARKDFESLSTDHTSGIRQGAETTESIVSASSKDQSPDSQAVPTVIKRKRLMLNPGGYHE